MSSRAKTPGEAAGARTGAAGARTGAEAERCSPIEGLRLALTQMAGAERRLRGRDHSRPGELTHAQIRALATLGREHELTAGQLAKQADLNPASVTAMLDQLEAANVVQRHRSTKDRRVCNVSLTPQGWELLERKLAYWHSLWEEKFAGFSDAELEAAGRVIQQVTELYDHLSARLDAAEHAASAEPLTADEPAMASKPAEPPTPAVPADNH